LIGYSGLLGHAHVQARAGIAYMQPISVKSSIPQVSDIRKSWIDWLIALALPLLAFVVRYAGEEHRAPIASRCLAF